MNRCIMTAAIIILSYNQKNKTERCIQSCLKNKGIDYKVFLWDNGSYDDTFETCRMKFPEVLCFRSSKNLGVAAGRNAAAKQALKFSPQYLLFLDNDTEVSSNFLSYLVNGLCDSTYGIASPKIKFLEHPEYLYGAGGLDVVFRKGKTAHLGFSELDTGQYDRGYDPIPSGGCFLVRTQLFVELKGFDEKFSPYGPEDIDFVMRLRAKGYKSKYVPESVIFHESNPSKTNQKVFSYSLRRFYHWVIILHRHASYLDIFRFILIFAPAMSIKNLLRYFTRPNHTASHPV